jgi:hypothetical protein
LSIFIQLRKFEKPATVHVSARKLKEGLTLLPPVNATFIVLNMMSRAANRDAERRKSLQAPAGSPFISDGLNPSAKAVKNQLAIGVRFQLAGKKNAGKEYQVLNLVDASRGFQYGRKESGKWQDTGFLHASEYGNVLILSDEVEKLPGKDASQEEKVALIQPGRKFWFSGKKHVGKQYEVIYVHDTAFQYGVQVNGKWQNVDSLRFSECGRIQFQPNELTK